MDIKGSLDYDFPFKRIDLQSRGSLAHLREAYNGSPS